MTEHAPTVQPAGPPEAEIPEDLQQAFAAAAGVCSAAGFGVVAGALEFISSGLEVCAWIWNNAVPDIVKAEGVIAWPVYADPALRETERLYNVSLQAVDAAWDELARRGKLPQDKLRAAAYLATAARERGWEKYAFHAPDAGYVIGTGTMFTDRYIKITGAYPAHQMQVSCFGWPRVPSGTSQADVDSFIKTAQELIETVRVKPLLAAIDATLHWIAQQAAEYQWSAYQYGWRWCAKCQGLFFASNSRGICPAGGSHDLHGSASYGLPNNQAAAAGQHNWRWCAKCQGLFFAGPSQGACAAGGYHDKSASGDYAVVSDPGAARWVNVDIQWQSTLDKGLTRLVAFAIADKAYLLTYASTTGAATFARFKIGSSHKITGLEVVATADWAAGWTHIVPFEQSGKVHLIVYNKQTGQVRFDRIKDDASGVVNLKEGHWAAGWSQVIALRDSNGKPHLVVYNAQTGQVRFDRIKDDASGSTNIKEASWATGWNALLPLSVGPDIPHLLVYDRERGRVRIDYFSSSAGTNVYDGFILANWSHLEQSGQRLMAYNTATGYAEIYQPHVVSHAHTGYIDFELTGYDIVFNAQWAPGWSSIAPLRVPYRSGNMIAYDAGVLFYNAESGALHVDMIEE